ncbi:hypothetical protein INT47_005060 [Mucor saturninus]|uniref:Thioredoxin domain-containing protein n=1 Tax=Mucor saturninus TaxID=64648 RepID=A0A8H7QP92_9FUNG|nr:hypothetical protein INT47_005060 [Mucor saturninus]
MVRLFTIAATVALLQYSAQALNIGEVTPNTIDNNKDSSLFVEYYSPECQHCSEFEPKWAQLSKSHPGATFAKLNCANHLDYCKEKGIVRVPTIQMQSGGGAWKEYTGDFSSEDVNEYIKANQAKRNEHGESFPIVSSKQIHSMISSKEPWFVKFYAPWCGHCKHLAPVWEELAKELQGQINLAEVNCESHKAICEEFKVAGLPTLLYFVHGSSLEYNGERSLEKLKDYALQKAGSPIQNVESDEELQDLFNGRDVNFVHITHPQQQAVTGEDSISFLESIAAPFMKTLPFFSTSDKKTALRFNLQESDLPASVIVKDGTFKRFTSPLKDLASWLIEEGQPLVTRVLPANSRQVLKGEHIVVLGITDPEDTESQSKLRSIAKIYRDEQGGKEITFAQLDGKKWGKFITRAYHIQSDKLPALVILDPKSQLYYDQQADQTRFSLMNDSPQTILKAAQSLETLTGHSTAPSQTMGKVKAFFVFFGDHWMYVTPVLFGAFALVFHYMTKEEGQVKTREQVKDAAKKTVEQNKEKKAAQNKAD